MRYAVPHSYTSSIYIPKLSPKFVKENLRPVQFEAGLIFQCQKKVDRKEKESLKYQNYF